MEENKAREELINKMLEKSQEAFLLAIEIYNKIDSEEGKESVYEFQAYNLIDQKRYDEVEKLYKYIKNENVIKDIQEEVSRQKTEN